MEPFLPDVLMEEYEPIAVLGKGGFGLVIRARHRDLQREVAIKLLRPDWLDDETQRQRFVREARITARIRHRSIVEVFGAGEAEGRPWIVYELLDAPALSAVLKRGPLGAGPVIWLGRAILEGLEVAHAQGIYHRDLKPENIFALDVETYKLIDFGISKWSDGKGVKTRTGVIFGTPSYLAPDYIRDGEYTADCDTYSMGVVMFEALTGRVPFASPNATEVLSMHMDHPVPRPSSLMPSIPRALEGIVMDLMAKEPPPRRDALERLRAMDGEAADSHTEPPTRSLTGLWHRPPKATRSMGPPRPPHLVETRINQALRTTSLRRLAPFVMVAMLMGILVHGVIHRGRWPDTALPATATSAAPPADVAADTAAVVAARARTRSWITSLHVHPARNGALVDLYYRHDRPTHLEVRDEVGEEATFTVKTAEGSSGPGPAPEGGRVRMMIRPLRHDATHRLEVRVGSAPPVASVIFRTRNRTRGLGISQVLRGSRDGQLEAKEMLALGEIPRLSKSPDPTPIPRILSALSEYLDIDRYTYRELLALAASMRDPDLGSRMRELGAEYRTGPDRLDILIEEATATVPGAVDRLLDELEKLDDDTLEEVATRADVLGVLAREGSPRAFSWILEQALEVADSPAAVDRLASHLVRARPEAARSRLSSWVERPREPGSRGLDRRRFLAMLGLARLRDPRATPLARLALEFGDQDQEALAYRTLVEGSGEEVEPILTLLLDIRGKGQPDPYIAWATTLSHHPSFPLHWIEKLQGYARLAQDKPDIANKFQLSLEFIDDSVPMFGDSTQTYLGAVHALGFADRKVGAVREALRTLSSGASTLHARSFHWALARNGDPRIVDEVLDHAHTYLRMQNVEIAVQLWALTQLGARVRPERLIHWIEVLLENRENRISGEAELALALRLARTLETKLPKDLFDRLRDVRGMEWVRHEARSLLKGDSVPPDSVECVYFPFVPFHPTGWQIEERLTIPVQVLGHVGFQEKAATDPELSVTGSVNGCGVLVDRTDNVRADPDRILAVPGEVLLHPFPDPWLQLTRFHPTRVRGAWLVRRLDVSADGSSGPGRRANRPR